jgi:hypothetical protein
LGKFQNDNITLLEARGRVKELFKGQTDLLLEFYEFLPVPTSSQQGWLEGSADETSNFSTNLSKNSCAAMGSNGLEIISEMATVDPNPGRGNTRYVPKNMGGVEMVPCAVNHPEKRKNHDRQSEGSFLRANCDFTAANNKRRLINASKLQNNLKKCNDAQCKETWVDKPLQTFRKFQRPEQLLESSSADGAIVSRRLDFFY